MPETQHQRDSSGEFGLTITSRGLEREIDPPAGLMTTGVWQEDLTNGGEMLLWGGSSPSHFVTPELGSPAQRFYLFVGSSADFDVMPESYADYGAELGRACRAIESRWLSLAYERAVSKLRHYRSTGRFTAEQEWVGRVDAVDDQFFSATLKDRRKPDDPEAVADIRFSQVSARERQWVRPGAFFYWVLGLQDDSDGSRSYVSRIRFRRPTPRDAEEISAARSRGRDMRSRLNARSNQESPS